MNTVQRYAGKGNSGPLIRQKAKKTLRITLQPYKRRIPIPVDLAPKLWRPVVGFEERYQVSSKGRIEAFGRLPRSCYIRSESLRFQLINTGYERAALYDGKAQRHLLVHRLVAMAFIPNPLGLPQINHKDSNRRNNTWANLEWVTAQGNAIHAVKNNPDFGGKQKAIPDHIVNRIIGDNYTQPKQVTIQQLSLNYRLSIDAVKKILRQHTKSNRHSQETLHNVVSDYRTRKAVGLTIAMIAQRYSLSAQSVRKIVARANKNARQASYLTSQTLPNHD
jgi:Mor family transcriptional regulator